MSSPSIHCDCVETIEGYQFEPSHLHLDDRPRGISAFMRIRNGEAFLELTIRSHIEYFDEIVAVYNDCTDEMPAILKRLQRELGPDKLRVIHYVDPVFPPGSEGHAQTPPDSPHSLVNYYNFALAATRYTHATKLDDDHLAITESLQKVTAAIRADETGDRRMHCFSGLNLFRRPDGSLGILQRDPISGGGDIGFFRVTPQTRFTHDTRFERFQRGGQRRQFCGFLYWHLKYLKSDMGFGNYALDQNPHSRYARRHAALQSSIPTTIELDELATIRQSNLLAKLKGVVSEKQWLARQRDQAIRESFPDASVTAAVARTVADPFHASFTASLAPVEAVHAPCTVT